MTEARNGREAIALIRDQQPDLVLLDVQMPRMDGFAVVQAVGAERMPAVIFVTAHDQYAIRAFEIAAVDYLLKPVSEERFSLAFQRAPPAGCTEAPHEEGRARCWPCSRRSPARRGGSRASPSDRRADALRAGGGCGPDRSAPELRPAARRRNDASAARADEHDRGRARSRAFLRIHRSHIVNVRRIAQLWSVAHGQYVIELVGAAPPVRAGPTASGSAAPCRIRSGGARRGVRAESRPVG